MKLDSVRTRRQALREAIDPLGVVLPALAHASHLALAWLAFRLVGVLPALLVLALPLLTEVATFEWWYRRWRIDSLSAVPDIILYAYAYALMGAGAVALFSVRFG